MTQKEWLKRANDLALKQSNEPLTQLEAAKAALSSVYLLMDEAPQAVVHAYSAIPETELAEEARKAGDRLAEGNWSWAHDPGAAPDDAALAVGVRLRALDRWLHDLNPVEGRPDDPDEDYRCEGTDTFLIPRFRPLEVKPGVGARTHFRRRGAIFHRIIPRTLGSYTIRLCLLDVSMQTEDGGDGQADEVDEAVVRFGAAMFENFELKVETRGDGTFRATGVECKGINATIRSQVDLGRRQGCEAIVWPELTMQPDQLEALQDKLANDNSRAGASRLSWVLAGSWHVPEAGDEFENVAPILDRYGGVVVRHVKTIPYTDGKVGREGIGGSYVIPVMITDEGLIAFATCKDFCDAGNRSPYEGLDVDLIVVGSMGDETTIQSHRAQAQSPMVLGKRLFIVQQRHETNGAPTGWVLPPLPDVQQLSSSDMLVGPWSTHDWDRQT